MEIRLLAALLAAALLAACGVDSTPQSGGMADSASKSEKKAD